MVSFDGGPLLVAGCHQKNTKSEEKNMTNQITLHVVNGEGKRLEREYRQRRSSGDSQKTKKKREKCSHKSQNQTSKKVKPKMQSCLEDYRQSTVKEVVEGTITRERSREKLV